MNMDYFSKIATKFYAQIQQNASQLLIEISYVIGYAWDRVNNYPSKFSPEKTLKNYSLLAYLITNSSNCFSRSCRTFEFNTK